MTETIIEAGARGRVELTAWKVMFQEMWANRELIARLSGRNISGQFRQSFFGYLWMILPPVSLTVVFSLLRQANVIAVTLPDGSMPYTLFALVGATAWGTFTQASLSATGSLANADTLVSKIYFPREVLIFSAVATNLVNVVVQLLIVGVTCLMLGYVPRVEALLLILIFFPLLLLAVGVGFFLAPLNAIMGDVQRLLQFIFQFGMFLAPTMYPTPSLSSATSRWEIGLYALHKINPVTYYLDAMRSLMETGGLPAGPGLGMASLVSLLLVLAGWRFFHASEPFIAERL